MWVGDREKRARLTIRLISQGGGWIELLLDLCDRSPDKTNTPMCKASGGLASGQVVH